MGSLPIMSGATDSGVDRLSMVQLVREVRRWNGEYKA